VHDLHFWTMDGQYNVLTLHVVVGADQTVAQVDQIKNEVKHCLIHLDVQHTTVEIESQDNQCYADDHKKIS
jgi:cobalt-zinc-cadmium efflux system protein